MRKDKDLALEESWKGKKALQRYLTYSPERMYDNHTQKP
jgi:hypothetical protein